MSIDPSRDDAAIRQQTCIALTDFCHAYNIACIIMTE